MASRSKHLLHALGQSKSFAKLSLKAKVLWPMMIAGVDDQGRFDADVEVLKWSMCPNVKEIAGEEIPDLLEEMVAQDMILIYEDGQGQYGQLLSWWKYQQPSYVRPSQYPPPPGWRDKVHVRRGDEWIDENWDGEAGFQDESRDSPTPSRRDSASPGDKARQGKTKQDKKRQEKVREDNAGQGTDPAANAAAADAAHPFFSQNQQILADIGISEPKRSDLAATAHVNPEFLEAWIEAWGWENGQERDTPLGQGWLIRQIERDVVPPCSESSR